MLIATWIITFVLIVGVGIYAGTKITQSNQWSGSDHSMGIVSIGCMLGAWQIGGMSVVGAAQNGYTMGIAGMWYSIAGGIYFLLMALLAGPLRRNMSKGSLPEFLQERYGTTVSRLQAYVWIVFGCVYIPIQLKTISSIIQIVLPGLNVGLCMFIGVTIAAIYTGFAGMKGSAAIGRVVCIGTYILLIGFVALNLGSFGGYSGLVAQLPEGYGSPSAMPTQRIVAWALGGALSSIVMQSALQPMLSAKDEKTARWGCVLGYVIAGPICILTAIIGMMSRARTAGQRPGRRRHRVCLGHQGHVQPRRGWHHLCRRHHDYRRHHGHHDDGHRYSAHQRVQVPDQHQRLGCNRSEGIPHRHHRGGLPVSGRRLYHSLRPDYQHVPGPVLHGYLSVQFLRHCWHLLETGQRQGRSAQLCNRHDYRHRMGCLRTEQHAGPGISHHRCQLCGGPGRHSGYLSRRDRQITALSVQP